MIVGIVTHLHWSMFTGNNADEISIILIAIFLAFIFAEIITELIHGKITSKSGVLSFRFLPSLTH